MKKSFLCLFFFLFSIPTYSTIYFGIGPQYLAPISQFNEINNSSLGLNFELTNRTFCKLWYGLRFDYIPLEKKENKIDYFERITAIYFTLKYAPFTNDCYDNKFIPFINSFFGFSSIKPSPYIPEPGSSLGLGGGLGIGIGYNFKLFKKCWFLELDGNFYAPNSIERASQRENLQSFNVELKLSIGL